MKLCYCPKTYQRTAEAAIATYTRRLEVGSFKWITREDGDGDGEGDAEGRVGSFEVRMAALQEPGGDKGGYVFERGAIKGTPMMVSRWGHDFATPATGLAYAREDGDLLMARGDLHLLSQDSREQYDILRWLGETTQWSWSYRSLIPPDIVYYEEGDHDTVVFKDIEEFELSPVHLGAGNDTGTVSIRQVHVCTACGGAVETPQGDGEGQQGSEGAEGQEQRTGRLFLPDRTVVEVKATDDGFEIVEPEAEPTEGTTDSESRHRTPNKVLKLEDLPIGELRRIAKKLRVSLEQLLDAAEVEDTDSQAAPTGDQPAPTDGATQRAADREARSRRHLMQAARMG